jgi:hypothetical protein
MNRGRADAGPYPNWTDHDPGRGARMIFSNGIIASAGSAPAAPGAWKSRDAPTRAMQFDRALQRISGCNED